MPSAARRRAHGIGWSQVLHRVLVADSTCTAMARFALAIRSAAAWE
ncbi:hypothetical protein AB0J72_01145 [Dactylosporangium sp. NPDC049742]